MKSQYFVPGATVQVVYEGVRWEILKKEADILHIQRGCGAAGVRAGTVRLGPVIKGPLGDYVHPILWNTAKLGAWR